MKNRRGFVDGESSAVIVCSILFAIIGGVAGYGSGWDAGVRDAVAGKATVIAKPDGTSEAVEVKEK